ncbi:hypothetical protein CBOM_01430 [Ceraceosorus bombacis]|uniref:Uncharacterized protein n=1 Tax=Ceraceosorus bombacis TaxID=401625 RepID=A0A0P1BDM3_9BASI|nr:hypothetical protein CBOM_01430 [Ceraceosorus bombacis]
MALNTGTGIGAAAATHSWFAVIISWEICTRFLESRRTEGTYIPPHVNRTLALLSACKSAPYEQQVSP